MMCLVSFAWFNHFTQISLSIILLRNGLSWVFSIQTTSLLLNYKLILSRNRVVLDCFDFLGIFIRYWDGRLLIFLATLRSVLFFC